MYEKNSFYIQLLNYLLPQCGITLAFMTVKKKGGFNNDAIKNYHERYFRSNYRPGMRHECAAG